MAQPAHLLIGTPAHRGQSHVDRVGSLELPHQGIVFTLMTIGNQA